jgi:Immunity protein 42
MLFGNKDIFAIECTLFSENESSKCNFGSISAWIGDNQIGDSSLKVILEIPVNYFSDSMKKCETRDPNPFLKMSYIEIWNFLNTVLWGDDEDFIEKHSLQELVKFDEEYSKYSVFTGFSEAFDGESVFLIESENTEKFIWQDFVSKEIKIFCVPLGTYYKVVNAFLYWYAEKNIKQKNQ